MIGQLATLICILGIAYLFWIDRKQAEGVSTAAWIPLIWMLFAGSRFPSQWLDLGSPVALAAEAYNDGSPIDRNVFLVLFIAGVWVLFQRRLNWRALFVDNAWVWLFFLYAAVSVSWSDDPFIAFKRWVKGFGGLVMALVILTDPRPYEALALVLRRMAYVLLPLSVLFIKYFPDLGREYHMGIPMYTGVAFQKNTLGQLCLLLGIYFCWELLLRRKNPATQGRQVPLTINLFVLPALVWLLYMAQSATSLALMFFAVAFFLLVRLPSFAKHPGRLLGMGVLIVATLGFLEAQFEIKDSFIRLLGREPDLTDRAPVWELVLSMVPHPLVGAGYESFWSGDRLIYIWQHLGFESGGIIQAHNGYIETYLNLGLIGVALLGISIVAGLLKARRQLNSEYTYAVLRIAFILTAVIYNYTEAAYKPLNNVFVLLLFSILDVRGREEATRPALARAASGSVK